jgi:two-component system chemotaxis response regulator CheY
MKLLIVDDSKTMRALLRRAILEAGYWNASIMEASTASEAVQCVSAHDFDLVCCDIHLADGTGFDVLRAIREAGSDVSFGFVTSDCLPETRVRAADTGAAFLINKPFTAETIARALSAAVKVPPPPTPRGDDRPLRQA